MTLPTWLEPDNARITIPVVLTIGYALYHWIRWRRSREEGDDDRVRPSFKPTESAQSVSSKPLSSPTPSPTPVVHPPKTIAIPPEAEHFWSEARGMMHGEMPDISTDWRYMNLLYKAAALGHLEAISKLGDHAFSREDLVEAFYWKLRVELAGGVCLNPSTTDIVNAWLDAGCPEEPETIKTGFNAEQNAFAYAVLCYKGAVDSQTASITLNHLADAGNADAIRFLRRSTAIKVTPLGI